MNKFKAWLWKCDDEGISNFDAICMFIWGCLAWAPLLIYVILSK